MSDTLWAAIIVAAGLSLVALSIALPATSPVSYAQISRVIDASLSDLRAALDALEALP